MTSSAIDLWRTAWERRDADLMAQAFAEDIVLHSPILTNAFRGRVACTELTEVLFSSLGDFEIISASSDAETHAIRWRARIGRRWIEGADFVHLNEAGDIAEIRVMIRPLVDIAIFAGAVGPPLATRRGPVRGFLARIFSLPLRGFLALTDRMSSLLVQGRS